MIASATRRQAAAALAVVFSTAGVSETGELPPLPEPRANVVLLARETASGSEWLAVFGIGRDKTWEAIRNDGYWWRTGEASWQALPPVPGGRSRLAAQGAVAGGAFWVFGGYTVDADGSEVSTPEVWKIEPGGDAVWQRATTMPVTVDDAVLLASADHYLYLISGWHDTGNVNLVQVFDTRDATWTQAEPWPGAPVFGHAGALLDNDLVVCGGAKIEYRAAAARRFIASDECWRGTIRKDDIRRLDWQPLPPMPGGPRYRAAAAALTAHGARRIVFIGGTDNPYNYNGIGYDGVPSRPRADVVAYDLDRRHWTCHAPLAQPRMDLRSAVAAGDRLWIAGGMDGRQTVRREVLSYRLPPPHECD